MVATQTFSFSYVHLYTWGFHDPIWRAYFSDGLKQPPSEMIHYSTELTYQSWGKGKSLTEKCRLGKGYVSFLGWWFYIVYSLHSRKPCWRTCWLVLKIQELLIPLDLFVWWCFYGFYHGTHHHLGEYVWVTFSIRIQQANLRSAMSKVFYVFIKGPELCQDMGCTLNLPPPQTRMPECTSSLGFPLTKI